MLAARGAASAGVAACRGIALKLNYKLRNYGEITVTLYY